MTKNESYYRKRQREWGREKERRKKERGDEKERGEEKQNPIVELERSVAIGHHQCTPD